MNYISAEQPSPQGLRRVEHEYSLAAQLDPAWAARPLDLTRHEGRTILVLRDPGGEFLDRVLERGQGQPHDYIRIYNQNPRPFHWIATASRIIRKVNRYKVISDTAD